MSARLALTPVSTKGWQLGLRTLLRKENRGWWATRRWWTLSLIWLLGVNGLVALVAFVLPAMLLRLEGQVPAEFSPLAIGTQAFFQLGTLALAVGVILVAQGAVQDEVRSGTAAWVLSKPVSRTAFILSKLIAHAGGILAVMVGLQSAIAYGLLSLRAGRPLSPGPFGAAVLGLALHSLFYLALTVLLNVLFEERGAVLGGSLGCLLGGSVLAGLLPPMAAIPPWSMAGLLPALAAGQALPTAPVGLSLAALAALTVGCAAWAIVRFRRIEF